MTEPRLFSARFPILSFWMEFCLIAKADSLPTFFTFLLPTLFHSAGLTAPRHLVPPNGINNFTSSSKDFKDTFLSLALG